MVQKIVANLWFNKNAREAAEYYVSVFPNSKITGSSKYPSSVDDGLEDFQKEFAGQDLTIEFMLDGQAFTAINAGAEFSFSEAISFAVYCKDQKEIDYYWQKLSAVPEAEQCGWCKDRFGVSWQIVPANIEELMARPNGYKTMLNQKKIVIDQY